ncbi:hypothetical protein QCN27_18470 [Cereibacter sp. SYSU M97828]|nr:hypothetical protein [Cereibacter flavus]
MKRDRKFVPMMQGEYDYFCSIYAIINFLRYRDEITAEHASDLFRLLLLRIEADPEGSVALLATEGLETDELKWVAARAGLYLQEPEPASQLHLPRGQAAIIFFEVTDKGFSVPDHYTFGVAREDGGFDLHDSYGFSNLERTAEAWTVMFDRKKRNACVKSIWREVR